MAKAISFLIIALTLCDLLVRPSDGHLFAQEDPDYHLTAEQFIASRDFTPEIHPVTTNDGVNLTVHRLINNNHSSPMEKRPVVLLMHPLLGTSVDFMYNSPGGCALDPDTQVGNNLAFELGKRGFDVWLGNVRGNIYSSHNFNSKQKWNFSLDEIIKFDLPKIIEYIMMVRNVSSINYIGHSQGSLIMFALLSSDTKSNSYIDEFIALGPPVYLKDAAASIRMLLQSPPVKTYLNICNKFLYSPGAMKFFVKNMCPLLGSTCESVVYAIVGFDALQLNTTRFPVYVNHIPAGTSCKVMKHYSQLMHSDGLQMYDYGTRGNLVKYGSKRPPVYDLTKITLNNSISIMFGANDFLTSPANVDKIRRQLKVQLDDFYLVPDRDWNHLDFIWGRDSGRLVNQRIIDILDNKHKLVTPES